MQSHALSSGRNDPLLLAGRILTIILQAFIALAGVAVTIAIPVVLFFQADIQAKIVAEHGPEITAFPAWHIALALLLLLGLIATAFVFFGKLRAIINSVGDGDPFAPENADRLTVMAWLSLAAYPIMGAIAAVIFSIAGWISELDDGEFSTDGGFDLTGILMVIILFILARVFRHGAAMREDLEGTV